MTIPIDRVLQGMQEGRITAYEAEAYLKQVHGIGIEQAMQPAPQPHSIVSELGKHWHSYALILAMALVVVFGFFGASDGLTGFVTFETGLEGQNITSEQIPVIQEITRLTATGVMYGEGSAELRFNTASGSYLVGEVYSDTGDPRTTQSSYAPGENVTLDHVEGNATYYLDDGSELLTIDMPFPAPEVGTYEILVIQNGTELTSDRVQLVVSSTPVPRRTVFTDLCMESCAFPPTNGTLVVTTTDTTVELMDVDIETTAPNNPPQLVVPFIDLVIEAEAELNLSEHFVDVDEDSLLYSTSQSTLVDVALDGALLTLTPVAEGTEELTIYVSDLEELVQERFSLSVQFAVENLSNETNITVNETVEPPVENVTNITTENQTIVLPPVTNVTSNFTPNVSLACDNPNPNLRPLECLQLNSSEYFPQEDIYWESGTRERVGKFNQIGNLLIKGDIVEQSSESPESGDFRLGNVDRDGRIQPVVWIDSSGNLHLRGRLFEEVTNMQPTPGSYSILTKRSIYLAYVDLQSGDMYLRGNVIPYRRSIE